MNKCIMNRETWIKENKLHIKETPLSQEYNGLN